MQMFPKGGGYKEQFFAAEGEHLIKGEHTNYSGGSGTMKPGHGFGGHGYGGQSGHFKVSYDQGHGYGGHNGEFKHSYDQGHGYGGHNGEFKHSYDQGHGYGEHNGLYKHESDKHYGYGGGHREEYSESFYERERRASMMRNDYSGSGYGGQYHQIGGMKHDANGGHQGQFGPHREQHSWSFKGIED